jgi:hypothetical protein
LIAFLGNASNYYVSKDGKNTNSGSKEAPFRTIQFGLNKLKPGDVCYVRTGIYRESIRFKRDGLKNKPIQLLTYPGEKVTITPTFRRLNWTRHAKNIYKTPFSSKVLQVFIGGKPSMQASFPNIHEGELSTKKWGDIYASANKTVKVAGLSKFGDITGSHLLGICGRGLVALNGKVVKTNGNTVTVQNDAFYWKDIHKSAYLTQGKGFLVGKYTFLDFQNEWFSDGRYLYFYSSKQAFNPKHIEVRTQQNAITLENRKHIQIQGITCFGGNISLKNSSHCILNKLTILYPTPFFTFESGFDRFGGNYKGINFDHPSNWAGKGVCISGNGNTLKNSIIKHSWGDGLTVWGENHCITNCLVQDCDWSGTDCAPLNITGNNHRVLHSTFTKSGRSVLVHRKLTHSKILHNEIAEGGLLNDDLGLTYTYDTDGKGTEIAYNWVHDNYAPHFGGGIYLDNNHKNFKIHHNVVWNCFVAMVVNQKAENDVIYNNSFIHNKYSMGACRPDGGNLNFTNIYSYNNITDSELKARDHDVFYGTKQVNNHFVPHLSNLMVNPTERQFQLRKNTLLTNTLGANISEIQGYNLQKTDTSNLSFHFLLFTFYFLLFTFLIYKSSFLRINSLNSTKNIGLFVLKLLGAFSLFWMYTYYYPNRETADIFKHFDDATQFYNYIYSVSPKAYFEFLFGIKVDTPEMTEALIHTKYWLRQTEIGIIGDNHIMIKVHAFLLLFSSAYYPIHLLFFAFISYVGSIIFYRFLAKLFTDSYSLLISVFFIPSVLFFCSGTLKETFIFISLISLITSSFYLIKEKKIVHLPIVIISTYLLVILKIYVILAVLPGLLSFTIFTYFKTLRYKSLILVIHVVYIILLLSLPSIDFIGNLQFKQNDLLLVANEMHAGSKINIPILDGTITSLIQSIPNALHAVFLEPTPTHVTSTWMLFSLLENYFVLGLILTTLYRIKYVNRTQGIYLTMVLSFCFLLALFIGWTVPIIGAIVRYKVIMIVLLVPSLIALRKIKK